MYTKRQIQPSGEPLRLPEHYSGVTFSRTPPTPTPLKEAEKEKSSIEETAKESTLAAPLVTDTQKENASKKPASLLGLSGREDILLLILALLLLDDEGGDDMLAYILLGLLVLG